MRQGGEVLIWQLLFSLKVRAEAQLPGRGEGKQGERGLERVKDPGR